MKKYILKSTLFIFLIILLVGCNSRNVNTVQESKPEPTPMPELSQTEIDDLIQYGKEQFEIEIQTELEKLNTASVITDLSVSNIEYDEFRSANYSKEKRKARIDCYIYFQSSQINDYYTTDPNSSKVNELLNIMRLLAEAENKLKPIYEYELQGVGIAKIVLKNSHDAPISFDFICNKNTDKFYDYGLAPQIYEVVRINDVKIYFAELSAGNNLDGDSSSDFLDYGSSEPSIGMTADEVRSSTWGSPQDINRTTTEYGVSEQWVYSGYRYIYLDDGIVTAIQE